MDEYILIALYAYGVLMFALVVKPTRRWLFHALLLVIPLRLFCIGMRTTLGSDVEAYTTVLQTCDLGVINAIEVFWMAACMPSAYLSDVFPFPFFWVGVLDCLLFALIAKFGGLRTAALYDLIYLLSTSMGAIRQGLAMKLFFLAVLFYLANRKRDPGGALLLSAPFVHLASVVPVAAFRFATSGWIVRAAIVALPLAVAALVVDEVLILKILFYLEFEGFRSAQDMYLSWAKRGFVIVSALALTSPLPMYWVLYGIALLFAASEFFVPEIAVRIGAYFEQFEVMLVGASMKRPLAKLGPVWYAFIAAAYTGRYFLNIGSLPR